MALKPDRWEFYTDISFFCDSETERGVVLVHSHSGSGVALDQNHAVVTLPGTGVTTNLKPAGLLLNDVIDFDPTRSWLDGLKNEVRLGGKVTLLKRGWCVTNMIATGQTPVAGDPAYLAPGGKLTTSATGTPPRVGTFLSAKDERGYAKVELNIA